MFMDSFSFLSQLLFGPSGPVSSRGVPKGYKTIKGYVGLPQNAKIGLNN